DTERERHLVVGPVDRGDAFRVRRDRRGAERVLDRDGAVGAIRALGRVGGTAAGGEAQCGDDRNGGGRESGGRHGETPSLKECWAVPGTTMGSDGFLGATTRG